MNKSKANFFNAHNLTLLAILIALVVVLQLFASSIPMFGITLNFALIPIVLAGILLGVAGGSIVGFACGLVVFITTAVLGQEPATAFLFQTNPVVLTLICIGKTTVAGAVCGLMFWWLKRYNVYLAVIISAFIDNIPYVATMIPVIAGIATALNIDATPLYFGLLSGATLGGNCTPVGASANITGIGILKKAGYTVKNGDFFKIGIPFTLAAVVPAYIYIWLMYGI